MNKYNFYLLSLFILVSILLSACKKSTPPFECSDVIGCVNIAPGEPIRLGVLQTLSGNVAPVGVDQTRGIQLALAKRDNQLLGHPIELQTEDERCTSEGGTIAAMKIVADAQIVAILGTTCSGAAISATKVITDAGMVMVSGSNTAPSLTAVGGKRGVNSQPGYFRTISNDAMEAQAVASFVFHELSVTKVATINDGDLYTRSFTDALKRTFTDLGGEIVLDATINKGDKNMHPMLTAVVLSGAELVFLPLFQPEGDFIIQQAKEVEGLEAIKFMGADSLFTTTFIKSVDAAGVGMYFIAKVSPKGFAFDGLVSEYKARYGELPHAHTFGFAYDAANMLLNAIEAVGGQEKNGTLHIGRQALREALRSTADLDGIMGRLNCDEFGDCGSGRFNIVRFDDIAAGFEGLISNVIYTYKAKQ